MRILLLQLVDGDSVWYGLDEAARRTGSDDVEGLQPKLQLVRLEDCLEFHYKLGGELLLGQVVRAFDNHRDQAIPRHILEGAFLLNLTAGLAEALGAEQALWFLCRLGSLVFNRQLAIASKEAACELAGSVREAAILAFLIHLEVRGEPILVFTFNSKVDTLLLSTHSLDISATTANVVSCNSI